jgi:acetolactate synthase-1/2/3 large subunit
VLPSASTSGNALSAVADVILAVGCRFTDWTASSYRPGVTFSIPPTTLIQIDIDSREIGKNYPVAVGIQADATTTLEDLLAALGSTTSYAYRESSWFQQIQKEKQRWEHIKAERRDAAALPMTQQRAVAELRNALSREAIVTTGAGVVQAVVRQDFPVYFPRTHITSGGFSTMGFTVPAALGAQLLADASKGRARRLGSRTRGGTPRRDRSRGRFRPTGGPVRCGSRRTTRAR